MARELGAAPPLGVFEEVRQAAAGAAERPPDAVDA
jgi:hypothetical protein